MALARGDLVGLGSRLPGGRHLSTLATIYLLAREADPGEQLAEQLPGRADERDSLLVFVESGRLADEHQVGSR